VVSLRCGLERAAQSVTRMFVLISFVLLKLSSPERKANTITYLLELSSSERLLARV